MVVLLSTGASRYHNCCIDGGTSPENFGSTHVHKHEIFVNQYDINYPELNCCVGPMMRPQQQQQQQQQALHGGGGNMYLGGPTGVMQHQHRMAGTYVTPGARNNQRPPNVSIGPDGINIGGRGSAEWRHLLLSQQQSAVFGTQMRPAFTQGGHQGKLPSDCLNCSHSVALVRHVVVVVYMKTVLGVLLCAWWMVTVCMGHTAHKTHLS